MEDVVKGKRDLFNTATADLAGMSINPMEGILKGLLGENMETYAKRRGISLETGGGGVEKKDASTVLAKTAASIDKHLEPFTAISSGLEQMGIKVPDGIERMIAITQGMSTILTGISALVALIQIDTKVTAAATATDAIVPFARGGIAHAASGTIAGHHFSGDNLPVLVNSGELILNKAQQGNIASQLSAQTPPMSEYKPYIEGEDIYLGMRNYLRRTGNGEIVTTKTR